MIKNRNKLSFKTSLLLLVMFFVLLGLGSLSVFKSNRAKQEIIFQNKISVVARQGIVSNIIGNVFYNAELFNQYLKTTNSEEQVYFDNEMNQSFKTIEQSLDSIRLINKSEDEEILVRQLYFSYQKFKEITLGTISSNTEISADKLEQYYLLLSKIKKNSFLLNQFYNKLNNSMSGDELETGIIIENIIVFIFGISIILGFWIIYKVSNELINSVNTINQAFEDIMHKNIGKVEYTGNIIELNILVEKLSETNKFFLDIRDFIANLANNKFDNNKFSLRNDFLSLELEKMRIKLIANEEMLKEQQTDTNQRDWINSGLSKFNEILRLYSGNLNELSSQLITSLVKYLNAIQGGIFISNDDQYEQLDLFASFAFNRKKYLQKTIKFGDGLVGTAVLEKRTIYLTELPADYLEISSGLGDTLPVALLIVPLIRDNEVYGALEISSFKTFSKTEIEFVEKVAELTGLTINTEKINQKTIRLLAESQRKSDELATQEEEMRQNLEELRAVQEESKKAQDRLQKTIDSIDQKLLKIELKPDKLVIDLNKRFLEISKMNLALLKGKNIEEIIALESVAEFKLSWQAAIEGKKSDIRIKFNIINNDFYGVLVPIFDIDSGHLTEMILFLSDMSDLTKQFNELNRKIEQGGKQISNFENDLKHTEQNAKSQKVISEQIFNLWTKHLALAQNEKEQKLELNKAILKLEEKTKVIVDKNTQLKQQLGQIIQNKSDNAELDNLYKDWLDNIEE